MTERIPQSTSKLVVFKAYLASDHVTEATSKTIAITISKNGGAFGNPNAGATNATEISSGWYKVTLDTTDTGTAGPLAVRGAVATIDDVGVLLEVVKATNGGYTALPDTACTTNASLITSGTGTAQLSTTSGLLTAGTITTVSGNVSGNVTGTIGGLTAAALKDFFDTDTTTTFASAIAGSVVYELASNAGTLTAAAISDAVWDEAISGHLTAGTTGLALSGATAPTASVIADAVWDEAASGHQTTGTFGQAIGDPGVDVDSIWALVNQNLNATVSSRASQTSVDTIDDFLDTEIADLPTNAELATALGTADDAVLAAIAALPTANANADALLDRANAVETGLTPRNALKLISAATAGKLSGGATSTNTIRNAVADSKDRIIATVDSDGNRTAITYDVT